MNDNYFKIDPECHLIGDMEPLNYHPGVQMWWRAVENIKRLEPIQIGTMELKNRITMSPKRVAAEGARHAYQIQFSPISNEMSRNMLMQFRGLPKSWV